MWPVLLVTFATGLAFAQATDLPSVGGFEGTLPSYWTMGNQPSGATLSWATDQFRSLGHSLKIVKPAATADTASWISQNMCDIWSSTNPKNVDILLGAYVKTQGVNMNPSTNDQRWYIAYDFWDSSGVFIGETKLPIDQSAASSTGWVADTNIAGATVLGRDSWTTIVKFVAGKNATGTVWADDFVFYGRAGAWAGQDWNTGVGVPTGWFYWLQPNGGNDGLLNDGFENTIVTTEAAHTGTHSLKFTMPVGRATPHDGWVAIRPMMFTDLGTGGAINDGDKLRISVWVKGMALWPDSAAKYGDWAVGMSRTFYTSNDNHSGYNAIASGNTDYTFAFPSATQFDWTQYTLEVTVPSGQNAKAMQIGLHVFNRFIGTVYFDDLKVEKVTAPTLADVGGFEGTLPSYWTMGNQPSGATLSWATDQFRSLGHSLKIVKPAATADTASWISQNMCDIWSSTNPKNVDILLGAYVKTQGVNMNPSTNDQRWYIAYDFWDSSGVFIGETKLPIDQSAASSTGWVADTNIAGATVLGRDSWTTIVKFVAGKNATGTVWADDFVFYGRAGAWAGQDWNTGVGVPTGWFYWLQPNGGNDGLLNDGFENTIVTTEAAHTGTHSLKFTMPVGRATPHDGWVAIRPMMFTDLGTGGAINDGDKLRISVWVKGMALWPDSAAKYGDWAVGMSRTFYTSNDNHSGYNAIASGNTDYTFTLPSATQFDWQQFNIGARVPSGKGAKAMQIGLHVFNRFIGTVYFDDVTVTDLGGVTTGVALNKDNVPKQYALLQNYPNPFNPTTNIRFALPRESYVTLIIYNVLGQKVRTLVDNVRAAGIYDVSWDGRDAGGNSVGSGMYFYRLESGQGAIVKKMLMLK
jgi:hypothetical protein